MIERDRTIREDGHEVGDENGTAADRDRYLSVLRAGGSDYGYNLLKMGGLDMASPEPYRLIVDSFSKVLDQAEALIA